MDWMEFMLKPVEVSVDSEWPAKAQVSHTGAKAGRSGGWCADLAQDPILEAFG